MKIWSLTTFVGTLKSTSHLFIVTKMQAMSNGPYKFFVPHDMIVSTNDPSRNDHIEVLDDMNEEKTLLSSLIPQLAQMEPFFFHCFLVVGVAHRCTPSYRRTKWHCSRVKQVNQGPNWRTSSRHLHCLQIFQCTTEFNRHIWRFKKLCQNFSLITNKQVAQIFILVNMPMQFHVSLYWACANIITRFFRNQPPPWRTMSVPWHVAQPNQKHVEWHIKHKLKITWGHFLVTLGEKC